MKIKVYGCKGSAAYSGSKNKRYGGNTSCFLVETSGRRIILDCGSGLIPLVQDMTDTDYQALDILVSHLHLDHIQGLAFFPPVFTKMGNVRIFTLSRNHLPLAEQLFGIYKPPYWPVDVAQLNQIPIHGIEMDKPFFLSEQIKVTPFPANHPDGTTAFRIEADKTLIYMLDFEIGSESQLSDPKLLEFVRGADVILFDGCYLPADYPSKKNWGHSTYEYGLALAKRSGCKRLILSHVSFTYADDEIDPIKLLLQNPDVDCAIAYDGMEYIL